jgi:periplasmic protein TonB
MLSVFAALLQLSATGPATATDPPAARPMITNPDWERIRNPPNILRFYPDAALRKGIEGKATIRCVVNAQGLLYDCVAISETPEGLGFGAAAVKMSILFKMRPKTKDGQPVDGGIVAIPINFALPH